MQNVDIAYVGLDRLVSKVVNTFVAFKLEILVWYMFMTFVLVQENMKATSNLLNIVCVGLGEHCLQSHIGVFVHTVYDLLIPKPYWYMLHC